MCLCGGERAEHLGVGKQTAQIEMTFCSLPQEVQYLVSEAVVPLYFCLVVVTFFYARIFFSNVSVVFCRQIEAYLI